jgi:hypothetical protein
MGCSTIRSFFFAGGQPVDLRQLQQFGGHELFFDGFFFHVGGDCDEVSNCYDRLSAGGLEFFEGLEEVSAWGAKAFRHFIFIGHLENTELRFDSVSV